MSHVMHSVSEVKAMIAAGKRLLLAGDEAVLAQLPPGMWIGGTIPYFMADEGGVCSRDTIYVTEVPPYAREARICVYDAETIGSIYRDAYPNGLSLIIVPASAPTHLGFALNAPDFDGFATRPLIGWVAGVFLDELGKTAPKVFDGQAPRALTDGAVVMHIALPEDKVAEINIVNIFEQSSGDELQFPADGFTATTVLVNGEERNFAEYIQANGLDTRLPLVADYHGVMINISFQSVDAESGTVNFYAPVFRGITYRHAKPTADYVESFTSCLPRDSSEGIAFSCNCILNYLYADLEGRKTGAVTGPITFGEVAYQLLNQTMAYVKIHDVT